MTPGSGEPGDIVYEQRTPRYAGFSESDLVEKPAIDLFAELGWQPAKFWGEFAGCASPDGRESKREVILPKRLRLALRKLNPELPETALDETYLELTRGRGAIDPIRANAEFQELIRDGVTITVRGADGSPHYETVRVIDWDRPDANYFLLASQVWFAGDLYTKRAGPRRVRQRISASLHRTESIVEGDGRRL